MQEKMKPSDGYFTFFVVMFLVSFLTNMGMRYFGIEDDLSHVIVMSLLTVGILKLIKKYSEK